MEASVIIQLECENVDTRFNYGKLQLVEKELKGSEGK